MITELKVGDYIEKSELDTEQKYNDVVEVFCQLRPELDVSQLTYIDHMEKYECTHLFIDDNCAFDSVSDDAGFIDYCTGKKLTYEQVMSLKKVDTDNCAKDRNKYHREIIGFCGTKVEVDVYRVLDAFKTGSAALDHAAKKMLCTGIRGHKDYVTDIDNAIESLQEARSLHLQKQEIDKA